MPRIYRAHGNMGSGTMFFLKPKLATYAKDGYELHDGEVRHRKFPDTYWIPEFNRRNSLKPGDMVQLSFSIGLIDEEGNTDEQTERMWVIVQGRTRGIYQGTLNNQPVSTNQMAPGLKVFFEPRHVIDIIEADKGDSTREH